MVFTYIVYHSTLYSLVSVSPRARISEEGSFGLDLARHVLCEPLQTRATVVADHDLDAGSLQSRLSLAGMLPQRLLVSSAHVRKEKSDAYSHVSRYAKLETPIRFRH